MATQTLELRLSMADVRLALTRAFRAMWSSLGIVERWDHENARGASTYDVEAREELKSVVAIERHEDGYVIVTSEAQPQRIGADGELVTEERRYRTVYMLGVQHGRPALFHLYGRLA